MYDIYWFLVNTPRGNYPWKKLNILSFGHFCALEKNHKINICHKVASEHTKVIEGMKLLITMGITKMEEVY